MACRLLFGGVKLPLSATGLGLLLLWPVVCAAPAAEPPRMPTVTTTGTSRLAQLEKKADDHDALAARCETLQEQVNHFQSILGPVSPTEGARALQQLETKALAYDRLTKELEDRDRHITELTTSLDQEKAKNEEFRRQIEKLNRQYAEATNLIGQLQSSQDALKKTVDHLLMGEFEYYQVKEGDTLALIAAKPMIYGDEAKQAWLRQANASRVEDPDKLRPGEMLIVPRFPPNGRFDF